MKQLPPDKWEKLACVLVVVCLAVAYWCLFVEEAPRLLIAASYAILLLMISFAAYMTWRRR